MALVLRRRPRDALRLHDLERLAQAAGVRTVLQDVVTCIRQAARSTTWACVRLSIHLSRLG